MKREFPGDVRTPAQARSFVTAELGGVLGPGDHPPQDDVALVVSELVTNSVRAGAAAISVEVKISARTVEIVVADDAGGWPSPRRAGHQDPGGRGLAIVDRLADSWETRAAHPGKRVSVRFFR